MACRDASEQLLRDPVASSDSELVPARAQASEAPRLHSVGSAGARTPTPKCNRPLAWGVPLH